MDYFQLLNLSKEPFSNSPDPEFFYPSPEHVSCLQKLELAIRLRRGLNVVVGAIGTGKTTLCRHLIREFANDESLETHLIFNPDFKTPMEFLHSLAHLFGLTALAKVESSKWQVEEGIRQYLFKRGLDDDRTVVLLIDEGQKMLPSCLEILRELLNHETNERKLLQIIIFAQEEFQQTIANHPNLADRINAYLVLAPLSFKETCKLLQFRLNQAKDGYKEPRLFTTPGLWAMYRATKGYPRRIIHLSHRVLLTMIIQNRSRAGWFLVRWCSRMMLPRKPVSIPWMPAALGFGVVALVILGALALNRTRLPFFLQSLPPRSAPVRQALPSPEAQSPKRTRIPEPLTVTVPEPAAPGGPATAATSESAQNETALPSTEATTLAPSEEAALPLMPPREAQSGQLAASTPEPVPPSPAPPQEIMAGPSSRPAPVTFQPPEVLGQVTTRPGDNLERMIQRVYGFLDQELLKAVMQLNPQISNFNAIEVGKMIKFPPSPVRADPLPKEGRYLQVLQANSLNEATKLLRTYPNDAPPVFLLPYWTPAEGLRFGLVLKDCCRDQQTAEATLTALPPSLATRARIIGKEADQAVFMVK